MSSGFPSLAHSTQPFPLPSIAEDTLDYTLHLPPANGQQQDPSALALLISEYVQSLLIQPWLWNKDSWELKVISKTGECAAEGGRLGGRMRVGDAVDDEWLVVHLLRQVSKRWPELVIGIRDTDGEFLLIEAADVIPSWVTPENATNRLWLQGGHLHLVPLSIRSAPPQPKQIPDDEEEEKFDPDAWIAEDDALQAVRTGKYRDEKLESAVRARIAGYPDALKTHLHHTKAYLPVPVAQALRSSPELVQKAVEGFYVRDPAQLRAASRMNHFPPSPSVLSPVLLTRAAYAQLQGQVFHPPRVFGPEWHVPEGAGHDDERRWRDLGVKISTGFEIMYREGGRKGRSGQAGGDEIKETDDYRTFLNTLTKAGFFKGELEGSEKWKEREEEAFKGYKAARSADSAPERPSFAFQVDKAVRETPTPASELQAPVSYREDSESWLEVSPEEVDAMLAARSGGAAPSAEADGAGAPDQGDERGQALSDLAKKVEDFVGGKGDMDGARFADELSDEDMGDSDDDNGDEEMEDTPAVREEKMRNLVPALPAEEWGRKASITSAKPDASESKQGKTVRIADPKDKDKPVKMRPPVFEPQEYDGVVSDSDDDDEEDDEPARAGSLGKMLGEMKWADMGPQIEEIDDDDVDDAMAGDIDSSKDKRSSKFGLGDDIDEAMKRRVWGSTDGPRDDDDDNVDDEMDYDPDIEAEQGDFLKFAQEALGLSDDQWQGIVSDRASRGAFVPNAKPLSNRFPIPDLDAAGSTSQTKSAKRPPVSETPTPPVQPQVGEMNMNLDSFEKVMEAMDAELAKAKAGQASKRSKPSVSDTAPAQASTKGHAQAAGSARQGRPPTLPSEADLDDFDDDDLAAMDRELKAALKSAGVDTDDEDEEGEGDERIAEVDQLDDEGKREYRMMKDFLESYKSQGGGSGVVGNLFGRLGEKR